MQNPQTSPAIIDLYNRYGTDCSKILSAFNPSKQVAFCRDEQRCYFGKAPSLGVMRLAYGHNVAESWMQIQLNDLAEFSGCKGKLNERQITELASIIISKYGYLKLTEFMLFFQKFKRGEYGIFYGNVDPMKILEAFPKFCEERIHEYECKKRLEEEAKNAEINKELEQIRERYIIRISDVYQDEPPISLIQYRFCGYDKMTDEELESEIKALLSGKKRIPKDIQSIFAMLKTQDNNPNA